MPNDPVHVAFAKITRILQHLTDEEQRRVVKALAVLLQTTEARPD